MYANESCAHHLCKGVLFAAASSNYKEHQEFDCWVYVSTAKGLRDCIIQGKVHTMLNAACTESVSVQ